LDKVIGLGKFGCSIAEHLTSYPEYRVYKIDSDITERGSLSIGAHNDMQEYENLIDDQEITVYLRSVKTDDEVLIITEGGEPISGALLRILSTIKDAKVSVLYVCPDRQICSEIQKRDDKICFNIIQQYARSGAIETVYLLSKSSVEALVGDVSIQEYEKSMSYFVSYVLAMVNYFNHTKAIVSNKLSVRNSCRIATFGVCSLENNAPVSLLFPLQKISDVHFYYGLPEETIEGDGTIMKKIKQQVTDYKTDENMSVGFSVYPLTLDDPFVACLAYSSEIQNFAFI
jgi:hypothetical protein